jgi:hypothetical protein
MASRAASSGHAVGNGVCLTDHPSSLQSSLGACTTHSRQTPARFADVTRPVDGLDAGVLRDAIRDEYTAVATRPDQGFHFHTGRPAADVVTLDRVICCFDDMDALVSRSGRKAGRFYGTVYPRKVAWMRVAIAALNLFQRLRGSAFRVFLHDPDAIDRVLRSTGLVPRAERHTLGWLVVVYARPAGAHR